MSDKKSTTQRTPKETCDEMLGLERVFFNAAMLDWYYTAAERYGSTKDVAQELRI